MPQRTVGAEADRLCNTQFTSAARHAATPGQVITSTRAGEVKLRIPRTPEGGYPKTRWVLSSTKVREIAAMLKALLQLPGSAADPNHQ
jgi:hypothetical protein